MVVVCPVCGEEMECKDVEDGAGDYAAIFTELYSCPTCYPLPEVPVSLGHSDYFANQFDDGTESRDSREDWVL